MMNEGACNVVQGINKCLNRDVSVDKQLFLFCLFYELKLRVLQ